jgi:iron complex outermembrane receptor protein
VKLTQLAQTIAMIGVAGSALAQTPAPVQRIEITGSSIKRIAQEGALPIQTFTRDDIEKAGISSTEQLVAMLAANGTGSDNMVSQSGFVASDKGAARNNGVSMVNLRGLGAGSTLVLLNGRRVATHGLSGKAVDLNSIPLAAIQRVEILTDGASAIYGTDAIGGVMNFILRQDYKGAEVSASTDVTEHGHGNISKAALVVGSGNIEQDGYNVMATLSVDKAGKLLSRDRDFAASGYQPLRGLSPDTVGTPYANIGAAAGTAIPTSFVLPGSTARRSYVSPLSLQNKCETIPKQTLYNEKLWDDPSRGAACAYDYGSDWVIMQPVKHTNLVARGTFKLAPAHTAFAELVAGRTESQSESTPLQITTNYPAGGPYYQDLTGVVPGFDRTKAERIRWRCNACGPRLEDTTADTWRLLAGLEGTLVGTWDYKLGASQAVSQVDTRLTGGYLYTAKFDAAMATGLINPWLLPGQTQTAQAQALLDAAKVGTQSLYGGRARTDEIDGTVTGELMQLPAGPLSAAVGFDLRRESLRFDQDAIAANEVIQSAATDTLRLQRRNIYALFTELSVPVIKNLDLQLAVRHDRYSDFGSTTNPKIAFRYLASPQLLLRGSANTGFHAPGFSQLYGGVSIDPLSTAVKDPVLCPTHPDDPAYCAIKPDVHSGGNVNLTPEKSKQWTLGAVLSPAGWITASIDAWRIRRSDRIASLNGRDVLLNYQAYGDAIFRKANGEIDYIQAGWTNAAKDDTSGVDLSAVLNGNLGAGRWRVDANGTYTHSYKSQALASEPMIEQVGEFGTDDLHLRWKHMLAFTYAQGPWSGTLTQSYKSGYKDQTTYLIPANRPSGWKEKVDSYTLYNATVIYKGWRDVSLSLGVKNLFDTDPPFSMHSVDDVAGAGWDSRVGDPRGRSYRVAVTYKFL